MMKVSYHMSSSKACESVHVSMYVNFMVIYVYIYKYNYVDNISLMIVNNLMLLLLNLVDFNTDKDDDNNVPEKKAKCMLLYNNAQY